MGIDTSTLIKVVKVLCTPISGHGGPYGPELRERISRKNQDYSKTIILAKEKMKNNDRFEK